MSGHPDERGGDSCPTVDDLFAFAVGRLPADARETIASHIESCAACLTILQELNDQGDPLLAELRQPVPAELFSGDRAGSGPMQMVVNTPAPDRTGEALPAPADTGAPGLPEVPGYRLLGELGRGGMGVVYKAWQVDLNRVVALKMILAGEHARPEDLVRFRAEAEAVAQLHHPHIVQIFEVGQHAGLPFFALEYLEGGSLHQTLQDTARPAREAAQLVETLARAMQAAHQRGIIHRDLKPANVLLDQDGWPKITDFGLAKRVAGGAALTQSGAIMGSPSYMAPEQAAGKGKDAGPAADVYALGAILYELLTGRPPFKAATPLETVLQVLHEEPLPPRRLQPKLPRDLETICLKCLHKEPAHRYGDAESLAEDLRRFQAGEPIRARPVGMVARGWKWARRRPAVAALVGVSVLAMAAGVTGVLWYADRESDRADQERALRREADQQREQTQAVLAFFQRKVLAAARPEGEKGGLGKDATIRAALDAAEPAIAQAFADQPAAEAVIRDTLGTTYGYLGEPALAIPQFERAVSLRQQALGPDHHDTLASLNNLAGAYASAGRLADALPLYEQVLKEGKARLGPDHPDTLASLNNLANAYGSVGRLADALPLAEEALEGSKARLGPNHPDTLNSLNNLAMVYKDVGRLAEALPLLEEALKRSKVELGPNHPFTLTCLNNLADIYTVANRLADALPLAEEALTRRKVQLGLGHPDTLTSMDCLAMVYLEMSRFTDALPLLEEARKGKKARLGPHHPSTLRTMNNLAQAYRATGRFTDALPLFEEVLTRCKTQLGPNHPATLTSMNDLALAYLNIGRRTDAVPLAEEALTRRKVRLGLTHPDTLQSMNNLALIYRVVGRLDDALPLYEEALTRRKAQLGPTHPATLQTMNNLAQAYRFAGRLHDALPLLEETLKGKRAQLGPDHLETLITMDNLGVAYQAAGRLADALPLFKEALKGFQAKLPPDHPDTLICLRNLAGAYLAANQADKALPILHDLLVAQRRRLGPHDPRLADLLAAVGRDLLKYGHHAEAEKVLGECLAIREAKRPDDWATFNTKSLLGASLLGQRKYAEAEPLLLKGYEGMKACEKTIPPQDKTRLSEGLERLVQLYDAWDKKDQADEWRKRRNMEPVPAPPTR
jgi:tetratricopeptide (TPR) repeat protein